jgi:hypothetical protein
VADDFSGSIRKFAKKTGITLDKVVRKVCIDMTADLVRATPVDTGMARSNWFFGTSRIAETTQAHDKRGSGSLARSAEFASTLKAGGVFYIANNSPYIVALEFGHSEQAPAGMARVTVARWQTIVNNAVKAVVG